MSRAGFLAVVLIAFTLSPAAAQRITFGDTPIGSTPKDFETALTGAGKPGQWRVVEDATAGGGRALAQLSVDPTDNRFPLAIYAPGSAANVEVTARFKPISGKVDQAGGLVVRFADADNYYVTRANALENNVRFYRVVAGRRQQLASTNTKVTAGEWHTIGLKAQGDRFTVSFDGKVLHTTADKTFGSPGKIGVWTKADSVTRFDWIEIKPLN
jgi:3-keto-disaccharide hydrolase